VIRFRALGAPDLRGDEATELREVLTQPRLLALLTYLALARPRTYQRRDTLLALFWPELSTEAARNALRQAVHRLRRALGGDVVIGRGVDELALDPVRFWSDVPAFEQALDEGRPEEALQLYRGDLLPGFHLSSAPDFERWLDGERDRLRRQAVAGAWALADRETAAGRGPAAVPWARAAAALTPDDEGALRRLLRSLIAAGDRAGAQRAYEVFAARLAEDSGGAPAPETLAVLEHPSVPPEVRRAPASPPSAAAPAPASEAADSGPPSVPARRDPWRRLLVPLAVTGIVLLAATAALVRRGRPDAVPAAKTLAVLPFTVRGSAELGYLREAMVDLLTATLDGAAGFHAVDPRSVIGAGAHDTLTADGRIQVARRLGASRYLRGDVVEIAGRLEIRAALYDVAAGPRAVATGGVSGETTELFTLVDELAARLLPGLAPGRDTTLTRLASLTTHSLPALKAYLEGEQALRGGRDGEAVAAFREAVTLDTGFALAQYRLAVSSTWASAGVVEDPNVWAERAAERAERLPPLVRDLLAAYRAYRRFVPDEAETLYRAVAEGHPHNVEAWLMLGETLFHFNGPRGRSPMEAWPVLEQVLALEPANPHAMIHLARLAARDGRVGTLDSLVTRYRTVHGDALRTLEMRALPAFVRGDAATLAEIVGEVAGAPEITAVVVFQDALLYAHHPEAAERLAPIVSRPASGPGATLAVQRTLVDLPIAGGRWGRGVTLASAAYPAGAAWRTETLALLLSDPLYPVAREHLAALREAVAAERPYPTLALTAEGRRDLGPLVRAYVLGLLSVRLGDSTTAAGHLTALAAPREGDAADAARGLAAGLRAEMARSAGDPAGALRALEDFRFAPTWNVAHWGVRERFLRAELLHALGRDTEALPWYDSFTSAYDTPWLAGAHLRMGEIHERLGNRERAAFHYTRFVRLWSACDAELRPLLGRAREALAELAVR